MHFAREIISKTEFIKHEIVSKKIKKTKKSANYLKLSKDLAAKNSVSLKDLPSFLDKNNCKMPKTS